MPKTTKREKTGADFIDHQKNIHDAANESRKSAEGKDKLDPQRQRKTEFKPDVDEKKTGQTKH